MIATLKRCLRVPSSWQVGRQVHLFPSLLIDPQSIRQITIHPPKGLKSSFLLKDKNLETASRLVHQHNPCHQLQIVKSESYKIQRQPKQWAVANKTKFLLQTQSICSVKHHLIFKNIPRLNGQKTWRKKMFCTMAWSVRVWSQFPKRAIVSKMSAIV